MKKIWILCLFILFLAFISLSFILIYLQKESQVLRSPLPDFPTSFKNPQVSTLFAWKPNFENQIKSDLKKPDVTAKSALVYDLTDDALVFAKKPNEKIPMASLTKIMTAIIALENQKSDDKYLVGKEDLIGEDSMGIEQGEVFSLKELLYGLILHSGNDAAETLASNFPGGRRKFIEAMNKKAKILGLSDTNFTNPTGLEGDGRQYTTAYDLLVITRFAIFNFPLFKEIVSTFDYSIPKTKIHKAYNLENETNLLTSYPGVKGVKTGYTPEAGFCLVTYLDYGGHKIIGILLGSDNRRKEMKELLDYSLRMQGIQPPPHG